MLAGERSRGVLTVQMEPQCVPCLLRRCQFEARMVDPRKEAEATERVLRLLSELYVPGAVSAKVAARLHAEVNRTVGDPDPYADLKERANGAALAILPDARRLVESSDDPFRAATAAAVIGNLMDFGIDGGIGDPEHLKRDFASRMKEGLAVDHTAEMARIIGPGARIVYMTDNCGEVVLDTLMWELIRKRGARLTVVAKDVPVLSDATVQTVRDLGFEPMTDSLLGTGPYAVGIDLDNAPKETLDALRNADLVVSKGMANFESMDGRILAPTAYLLRTKCAPVARALGAAENANIAMVVR